jgi:CheY-like chemotaxis protein
VRLPRLAGDSGIAPADAQSDAAVLLSAPAQPLRVMIVDDNTDSANMLATLLEATGYETVTEHTALQAIERARRAQPQVCLLDIGLPDMDGTELARQLRAIPDMTNATLIAVTGYGQERDRQRSKVAGFDHHLVKPVDIRQLLTLIAQRGSHGV